MKRDHLTSLSARIIAIVMLGIVVSNGLTWLGLKREEARLLLEIPSRLAGVRIAQAVALLDALPVAQAPVALAAMTAPGFRIAILPNDNVTQQTSADKPDNNRWADALITEVIRERLERNADIRVRSAALMATQGARAALTAYDGLSWRRGEFVVDIQLHDGRWLRVDCIENEAGFTWSRGWWLYGKIVPLAVLLVILAALIHLCVRPFRVFADAANDLGRDLERPSYPVKGPRELRAAITALNDLQTRLRGYISERTRMLAAISHDLRSPITRLRLRAEFIEDDDTRDRFRADLVEMEALANETLELTRAMESGGFRKPVDMNALLEVVQSDAIVSKRRVTISGQALKPVIGYALSLKRCFSNLVENALRYSEGDVDIVVTDNDRTLEVVVRDFGPGIPDIHLERVFEPFYRVEASRNRETGGAGLGLSIAHQVVLSHHGTLELVNRVTGGLDARVHIPRKTTT
jgi:signal transduction histidine kinase